jgi:nucleoside-diphosphate-sugar epimerase
VVETNVLGTLNVLEAVAHHGIERFVHTSTSEVYGTAQATRITETHPLQGQSPYSASKIGADKLVEAFWRSFSTPAITLRPFNTYGPRQSPRAVIPTILSQALSGGVVRLGSLAPTRDFTFVDDTVRGFLLALTANDVLGEVIHLGTGEEVSIGRIVELAADVVGHALEVVEEQSRIRPQGSEVERLLSDPTRARERLGWEAKVSLSEGLARTADWLRHSAGWFRLSGYAV